MVLWLGALLVHAQADVTALEYYIDTDPGVGNGTSIGITQGQEIDLQHSIDMSSLTLSSGVHLLVVRAQNASGDWSFYEVRNFFISDAVGNPAPVIEDIVALEYYIDEDPGVGNGTDIAISTGSSVDILHSIDISSLSLTPGYHKLGIRAQNAAGRWSMYEMRKFLINEAAGNAIPAVSDIVAVEYFIDTDPGQGNGESIPVTSGSSVDTDHIVTEGLTEGWHTINVRAQNAEGLWSFSEKRRFYVTQPAEGTSEISDIVKIEYFFNSDPGIGQATAMDLGPASEIDIASLIIDSQGDLPIGTNSFGVRAQNAAGEWGFTEIREFDVEDDCTQPIADFEIELACAGDSVTFIDISTNLQDDASYTWYLDGAELIDETDSTFSMVFDNPGEYTMSMVVNQGQICKDSVGATITIKEQPIVVFSADPVYLGDPTVYNVDTFYVDPESTWTWDFENDGIADDGTKGDNSFAFGTIGSYTTTLLVTDGLGCDAFYSREVEVLEEAVSIEVPDNEISVFDGSDNSGPEITTHQAAEIDLGQLDQDQLVSRTFTIENVGTDVLAISSVISSNDLFVLSGIPLEVAASGLESFTVSFSSSEAGQFSTSIVIESDDEDESVFVFVLKAEVIGKSEPNLTFGLTNKTYGDADFPLDATSLSDGAITYFSSDASVIFVTGNTARITGVGTCTISASQEGTDQFVMDSVAQLIVVNKKTLIGFVDHQIKGYGDTNPELTIEYDGFVGSDGASSLDLRPSLTTRANESSPVGTYDITATDGMDDRYEIVTVDGSLEVLKKELVITADDQTRMYRFENPELTLSYSGFVNGENETDITPPSVFTAASVDSREGTYDIFLNGGSADNYDMTLVNGTLTIIPSDVLSASSHKSGLMIYPNPVQNLLSISYERRIDQVSVFDIHGKLVMEINERFNKVDVQSLPEGIYLVKVLAQGQTFNQRIIKQ